MQSLTQSNYAGRWWGMLPDGRIECQLCPRFCKLNEGQRGFCFVRQRVSDRIVLTTSGRSSGFCVDPIEKKPLNHFLPGPAVLSFGTAGCNLACRFCQKRRVLAWADAIAERATHRLTLRRQATGETDRESRGPSWPSSGHRRGHSALA